MFHLLNPLKSDAYFSILRLATAGKSPWFGCFFMFNLGLGLEVTAKAECLFEKVPEISRNDVYSNFPFKAGEEAKYNLNYAGVHVGYGFLRVKNPIKESIIVGFNGNTPLHDSAWHMQFQGEAYTGEWYSAIFQGQDVIQAISRPWNFSVSKFYMRQNEKAALKSKIYLEKWLTFAQQTCRVYEKTTDHGNGTEKSADFEIINGSVDVLGALHKLRTFEYQIGKPVRFQVYSSEKNWIIEAKSVAREKIKVGAGEFEADKLFLKTFIGKDLQTNGDSYVWIASAHPSRPMIKVEAEVKFGTVSLYLESFKPGI